MPQRERESLPKRLAAAVRQPIDRWLMARERRGGRFSRPVVVLPLAALVVVAIAAILVLSLHTSSTPAAPTPVPQATAASSATSSVCADHSDPAHGFKLCLSIRQEGSNGFLSIATVPGAQCTAQPVTDSAGASHITDPPEAQVADATGPISFEFGMPATGVRVTAVLQCAHAGVSETRTLEYTAQ